MNTYAQIFENNRQWVSDRLSKNPNFFKELSKDQSPEILYIGCSDSRVPANEIMGLEPGEVFVHRNIANLVPNIDLNSMSVIHYAVEHLHVKYIVICGHYNCGGVKAAMQPTDEGILNPWLRNIRDVFRLHKNELDAIHDEGMQYNRLVELNVYEQCINVIKTAEVQKSYAKTGYPIVQGCVLDLTTGVLIDMKIDFEKELNNIKAIYDLTKTENKNANSH
ncbi:MAG TPA: carbonic anhydrase [Bacteroidales bacterium]|nr:carbonic anhydrase [Bacteroidales bacterium]